MAFVSPLSSSVHFAHLTMVFLTGEEVMWTCVQQNSWEKLSPQTQNVPQTVTNLVLPHDALVSQDADRDNSAHRERNGPGSGLMSCDGERNALI